MGVHSTCKPNKKIILLIVPPIDLSIYHFLILLVILQGFFLAAIFLLNKKFRRKSNQVLGAALIAMSFLAIGHLLDDLNLSVSYPVITYLPIRYTIVLPIALFYIVTFLLHPRYQLKQRDYWFIFPLLLQLGINFLLFIVYLIKPTLVEDSPIYFWYVQVREILSIAYSLVVIFIVLKQLRNYQTQLKRQPTGLTNVSLKWIQNSILALFVLCALWIVGQLEFFFYGDNILAFHPTWLLMGLLVFWLGYFIILRRDIFEVPVLKETNKTTLSDKTAEHFKRVLHLIESEKLYRNPALSMDMLAEKSKLSNGYLSQIINQKEGKNFYDFINTYRVTEVKAHLKDAKFDHYSILGIGLEAGFQSKSTFNAVFKKMTGMTPTQYKKVQLP